MTSRRSLSRQLSERYRPPWRDKLVVAEPTEYWSTNWAWSIPLIMATVLTHSYGLLVMHERVATAFLRRFDAVKFRVLFAMVVGTAVLFATILHALEGAAWAAAYLALGALPDAKSAMLYSLEAMTTYGHATISLEPHWRMMGALEALNGLILFGLTTAFLFAVIQSVSPLRDDRRS